MMRELLIEATDDTPEVILSKERGLYRISGVSTLEDASSFYNQVQEWLDDYANDLSVTSHFDMQFTAISQSSMKSLLFIFRTIKSFQLDGHELTVTWYVPKDNKQLKEVGQDLSYMTDLSFQYILSESFGTRANVMKA